MNELIKVRKSEGGKSVVSARELYQFLEASERFSAWMDRQFQYGFTQDIDYVGCKVFNAPANQYVDDFAITIDCAKEISMLQKSDKGKQARLYFIECEKQLIKPKELSRKELALMIIESEEAKELAEKKVLELEPKAQVFDEIMSSEDCIDLGEASKIINIGYGRNRLFEELRNRAILMKNNIPYQQYIDAKYFKCIETRWNDSIKTHVHIKTLVTQRGINWLNKLLK